MHNSAVILLAGGSSQRMADASSDKILHLINNQPIFSFSLKAFHKTNLFTQFVIVYKSDTQKDTIQNWISKNNLSSINISFIKGGPRRQDSVLNGLKSLPKATDFVHIHDLARPLINPKVILSLHAALSHHNATALAHPPSDTIHQIDSENPDLLNPLPRDQLWAMETPQAFQFKLILDAYKQLKEASLTDCASTIAILGKPIKIIHSPFPNPKITYPSDITYIETLLNNSYVTL